VASTTVCKGCGERYKTSLLGWQNFDLCKPCFDAGAPVPVGPMVTTAASSASRQSAESDATERVDVNPNGSPSRSAFERVWGAMSNERIVDAIEHLSDYIEVARDVVIAEYKKRSEAESIANPLGRQTFADSTETDSSGLANLQATWRTVTDDFLRVACVERGYPPDVSAIVSAERVRRIAEAPEKATILGKTKRAAQSMEESANRKGIYEVLMPTGELRLYTNVGSLRNAILADEVRGHFSARSWPGKGAKYNSSTKWTSLRELGAQTAALRLLYRPIWSHTVKGGVIGGIVGIGLKALDTTWLFYEISPQALFLWLLVCGSMLASVKLPLAPVAVMVFMLASGVKGNFFLTVIGVQAIGVALGAPLGMIVGTLVGRVRDEGVARARDAKPEGLRPYMFGLVLPALWSAIAIPGYFFLNRWLWDSLSAK